MIAIIFAVTFGLLFVGSSALLYRSTKNSLQMLDKFDELEEQLDLSLKLLTEKRKKIDEKTKMEVFFDDPVVKELLKDITECRDAVAQIIENFEQK